jgi:hypothetical protein
VALNTIKPNQSKPITIRPKIVLVIYYHKDAVWDLEKMECRISNFLDGETVLYYVYFLFMKISETFAIKTMTVPS